MTPVRRGERAQFSLPEQGGDARSWQRTERLLPSLEPPTKFFGITDVVWISEEPDWPTAFIVLLRFPDIGKGSRGDDADGAEQEPECETLERRSTLLIGHISAESTADQDVYSQDHQHHELKATKLEHCGALSSQSAGAGGDDRGLASSAGNGDMLFSARVRSSFSSMQPLSYCPKNIRSKSFTASQRLLHSLAESLKRGCRLISSSPDFPKSAGKISSWNSTVGCVILFRVEINSSSERITRQPSRTWNVLSVRTATASRIFFANEVWRYFFVIDL